MRTRKEWTDDEVAYLQELVIARRSAKHIARLLGRTYCSVQSKKSSMNMKKPAILSANNPSNVAEIVKFRMAGWKLREIARIFKCDVVLILRILKSSGFDRFIKANRQFETENYRRWDEIDLALMRNYCKKGYSFDFLCAQFPDRSVTAVRYRIQKMTKYWSPKYIIESKAKPKIRFNQLTEDF